MNKQEQTVNAQKHILRIHNIRKNHLATLEETLKTDPNNAELQNKVVSYRAFIAEEQIKIDSLFVKMGWA